MREASPEEMINYPSLFATAIAIQPDGVVAYLSDDLAYPWRDVYLLVTPHVPPTSTEFVSIRSNTSTMTSTRSRRAARFQRAPPLNGGLSASLALPLRRRGIAQAMTAASAGSSAERTPSSARPGTRGTTSAVN